MEQIVITTFYQFFDFPNYENEQIPLLSFCKNLGLKGTILIAKEGINSTISGTREAIDKLYTYLHSELNIKNLDYKESIADFQPFLRMKVRLKKEIVALGAGEIDIEKFRGEYIEASDWDKFIEQENVILVDTRNNYEIILGSFKNAVNPFTDNFRKFPEWATKALSNNKDAKIAMYCTGGIRCEKSTAYLKQSGFKEVYHLKGGILKYLEDTKNKSQKWEGSCFVFDDRLAVNNHLLPAETRLCKYCRLPITTDDVKALKGRAIDSCYKCSQN
jgi:UPF0176 protein